MKATQARELAEECRMYAGVLFGIAIAAAIAAACVWYSIGAGMMFLLCLVVAAVCGVGFLSELAEARRHDRHARQCQPIAFETHCHE